MEWLWSLIGAIIIGGLAGWLASKLMTGRGLGLIGDVVVGIVGAIGSQILFINLLNIQWFSTWGWIGSVIWAVIGAVILLAIVGLFKRS